MSTECGTVGALHGVGAAPLRGWGAQVMTKLDKSPPPPPPGANNTKGVELVGHSAPHTAKPLKVLT